MHRPRAVCLREGAVALVLLIGLAPSGRAQRAQAVPLPPKVTLVPQFEKLGLTPLAQGNRDDCSLFAMTAVAEFESGRHQPKRAGRLSEEFLIWAADQATGRTGDQAMFYEAFYGLETFGICAAGLMPYSSAARSGRKPSPIARENARELAGRWRVHWLRRWNVARPLNDAELHGIKASLASGHPVACGLRWPKSLKGHLIREVPPPAAVHDGHSIVFVGYEDDRSDPGGGMFLFRNSFGDHWGEHGYGRMSYGYVRAYANDALWLRYLPVRPPAAVERLEAESMLVIARHRCETSVQDMADWGRPMWGGGRQLLCKAQPEGSVTLAFANGRAGRYRLQLLATAAPDFGIVRASLDGKHLPHPVNLYSGRVCPAGAVDFGTIELSAGRHTLQFTAVGKDPVSGNDWFGLDAIELYSE